MKKKANFALSNGMEVFNMLNQRVTPLLSRESKAGYHEIEFIGENLPLGIYYYRIEAGKYQDVKKMVLLK